MSWVVTLYLLLFAEVTVISGSTARRQAWHMKSPQPFNSFIRGGTKIDALFLSFGHVCTARFKLTSGFSNDTVFPQITVPVWWCTIISLNLWQLVFEQLINAPRDGSPRHLVEDACVYAFEKSWDAVHQIYGPKSTGYAHHSRLLQLDKCRRLLSVENSLAHVQRSGAGGGHSPRRGPGYHVCLGVVLSVHVKDVLELFIGDNVDGVEGNIHGHLCGEGAVECLDAFHFVHLPYAVKAWWVRTVVHLHALFDHWKKFMWISHYLNTHESVMVKVIWR